MKIENIEEVNNMNDETMFETTAIIDIDEQIRKQ